MCVFGVHVCVQSSLPKRSKFHAEKYTSGAQTCIFSTQCGGAGVLPLFSCSAPSDMSSFNFFYFILTKKFKIEEKKKRKKRA